MFRIVRGRDRFVAATTAEPAVVLISDDGVQWDSVPLPGQDRVSALAWGDDRFVVMGTQGGMLVVSSSTDGWTWRRHAAPAVPIQTTARELRFDHGIWTAIGTVRPNIRTDIPFVMASTDLESWTFSAETVLPGQSAGYFDLVGGNGVFVKLAWSMSPIVGSPRVSSDGRSWKEFRRPDAGLQALEFGDGRFMAFDSNRRVLSSTNGETWTDVGPVPFDPLFVEWRFAGGRFFAMTSTGIQSTTDGIRWETFFVGPELSIADLAYGPSGYCAAGSSQDGVAVIYQGGVADVIRTRLGRPTRLGNGVVRVPAQGPPGTPLMLEQSSGLDRWSSAGTLPNPDGLVVFDVPASLPGAVQAFFRVRSGAASPP